MKNSCWPLLSVRKSRKRIHHLDYTFLKNSMTKRGESPFMFTYGSKETLLIKLTKPASSVIFIVLEQELWLIKTPCLNNVWKLEKELTTCMLNFFPRTVSLRQLMKLGIRIRRLTNFPAYTAGILFL